MTTPYICGRCRGRLPRQVWTFQKLQPGTRAGFTTFNTPLPEHKEADTPEGGEGLTNVPRSPDRVESTKISNSRQSQWPIARTATDEILESLFLTPRTQTSTGRYKTRYSASSARDGESRGNDDGSVSNSSSATGRLRPGVPKPPEARHLFRRARKPPISTLKRLPAQHAQPFYKLHQRAPESRPRSTDMVSSNGSDKPRSVVVASVLKGLGRAMERTDFTRADALWREITQLYQNPQTRASNMEGLSTGDRTTTVESTELEMNPTTIPMKVYNFFLLAFMTVRRPDSAIDVWNHMVSSGRQPEQASWGAMLNGCRTARDPKSIETIWAKMRAVGVKPDVQSWTTRIGGLIRSGKWDLGIRALEEMGDIWKEAARQARVRGQSPNVSGAFATTSDIGEIVKPSSATINVVLAGLIKTGKGDLAPRILAWAKAFGIESDIVTFNTLLQPAVRNGSSGEVSELLQQMETLGIQPDVVTFTIILDGLFKDNSLSPATLSPKDQQAAVTAIVAQMEDSGVQANVFSYGTIIDNLLKSSVPNLPAARAVLDHMASRNIKPSPHIYTILLTYYFSQTPPNLAALDVLWNRIKIERGVVDHIFYDRMLEGYGRLGEFGKMMTFLRRMAKEGKAPGWDALVIVLRTVIQAEEWDMARDLINDVDNEDGLFHAGIRGRKGEDEFRELVEELKEQGLVGSMSVTHGSQAEAATQVVAA
ncbi:MAG: hypothetical protein M1830_000318 [Pleopsidium flavum]|nr:MAG: hypothetical protein M1830_000318 [Pleopsidium flavum]